MKMIEIHFFLLIEIHIGPAKLCWSHKFDGTHMHFN